MNAPKLNFNPTQAEIDAALAYFNKHREAIEWEFAQGDETATLLYMEHIAYEAKPCRYNGAWLVIRQQRYEYEKAARS